jgi:uncharacterized protein (TIGR00369 family)
MSNQALDGRSRHLRVPFFFADAPCPGGLTMQAMTKSPTHPAPPAPEFEEEFTTGLKAIFEEKIAFNQLIGLKVTSIKADSVTARIDMRNELIGHAAYNRIHGGVISAGLDAMGALAVMAAIGARHMDDTPAQRLQRFYKLGTIDLRVDYLRPGVGEYFELRAEVLRLGSRVASTRMEFVGADGQLLSMAAAAYIVS